MKAAVIAPALFKLDFGMTDDMPLMRAANRWSWHHIEHIACAVNQMQGREKIQLNPQQIIEGFAPLCGLFEGNPVVTATVQIEPGGYGVRQHNVEKFYSGTNISRIIYIPAGWGMRILTAVKIGPIVKVEVSKQDDRHHLSIRGYDIEGKFISELPIGNVPIVDPNRYDEP